MRHLQAIGIWTLLLAIAVSTLGAAASSPLLEYRGPVYVMAGLAGVVGLCLMLFQPLLAAGLLPGLTTYRGRRIHRWIGGALILSVLLHVIGLWITSPPDVIDALLFTSPTPFSAWGVIAMWALFATALLAITRRRFRQRLRVWRGLHSALAVVIVLGTVIHSLQIVGTMETVTKLLICTGAGITLLKALHDLGVWRRRGPRT